MAGGKRGSTSKTTNKAKVAKRETRSSMGNENKQSKTTKGGGARKSATSNMDSTNQNMNDNRSRSRVRAQFVEGDDLVEMEAAGQATDFAEFERDEQGSQPSQPSVTESSESDMSESEDEEVVLSQGRNMTNAKTIRPSGRDLDEASTSQYREVTQGASNAIISSIEDQVNTSLTRMQRYVDDKIAGFAKVAEIERQLAEKTRQLEELKDKGKRPKRQAQRSHNNEKDEILSKLTIYDNAVKRLNESKRGSSSSEDLIDTSDELLDVPDAFQPRVFFAEREMSRERSRSKSRDQNQMSRGRREVTPKCSASQDKQYQDRSHQDEYQVASPQDREDARKKELQEKSDKMIREAEASKARIYEVSGNNNSQFQSKVLSDRLKSVGLGGSQIISALIDETYKLVGSHLDQGLREKILNHEYVDFSKLLPKNNRFMKTSRNLISFKDEMGTSRIGVLLLIEMF